MTIAPIPYDPDNDIKHASRTLARALTAMAERGEIGPLYGQYSGALMLLTDRTCKKEPVLPPVS